MSLATAYFLWGCACVSAHMYASACISLNRKRRFGACIHYVILVCARKRWRVQFVCVNQHALCMRVCMCLCTFANICLNRKRGFGACIFYIVQAHIATCVCMGVYECECLSVCVCICGHLHKLKMGIWSMHAACVWVCACVSASVYVFAAACIRLN